MVPKIDSPETVAHFRPIALCNVFCKGINKIIVQGLKGVMNQLVSPYQVHFVPGRSIHDDIVIAKEIAHSMNRMRGGKGYLAVKIDLEKAYDRMNWSFIVDVLNKIGLPDHIVALIEMCISTISMAILWNGDKGEEFYPSRGETGRFSFSLFVCVRDGEAVSYDC